MNRILLLSLACCILLLAGAGSGQAAGDPNGGGIGPLLALSPIQPDGLKVAIFPVQNMSGMPAPVREISRELLFEAERTGIQLVDSAVLEAFFERHWVRQLGYIDGQTAQLLKRETGADVVLLSNIEMHRDEDIPRFALIARLVELDELPRIIWMESAALTGDQNPGLLELGVITDAKIVRGKVLEQICSSLQRFSINPPIRRQLPLASKLIEQQSFTIQDLARRMSSPRSFETDPAARKKVDELKGDVQPDRTQEPVQPGWTGDGLLDDLFLSRYNPLRLYSSVNIPEDLRHTVAIVPFIDHSTRKNAAELLELHIAKQLVHEGSLNVLEIGVVRAKMLAAHLIMDAGISVPAIDAISHSLKTDMIINGKVFDYTETTGVTATPVVDFSLMIFERDSRRILWSSNSRNRGDDGVFFYDWGRIYTAATLADNMSRALIRKFTEQATGK